MDSCPGETEFSQVLATLKRHLASALTYDRLASILSAVVFCRPNKKSTTNPSVPTVTFLRGCSPTSHIFQPC